jgi:regulator of replication initiation timing
MGWLSHPLTVATYAVLISLSLAGVKAVFQLFQRVKSLEASISALHTEVSTLSHDLRAHMLEETRNVQHLESSVNRILALMAEQKTASSRVGLRSE